ncbi:MAG: FAD-dependent oxidoreductase [Deltaproteobacteria bacterium]|nr:FAD-dependent oxidoreductase [Deltaproteobacteria bacterium]
MVNQVVYSTRPEDYFYMDINVPCQSACPALTNIPSYIRQVFENNHDRSYEINRMANILPGVLGRICSRPCEKKCRHGEPELGRPVNICHIKRSAADFKKDEPSPLKPILPSQGKGVAIIGSGPAGLAAAHDLATLGFSVTIYEALDQAGGMLRYGIPEFRLPRPVLDAEIDALLGLGIVLKTGTQIGRDGTIRDILTAHNAVLIAAGCYQANRLGIEGEDLPGVYPGLQFMMDFCSGRLPARGKRVLVLGAGFSAFDCARSALRLGAKEMLICLRRTEEDLVVTEEEVRETRIEGIKIQPLMLSRRILGKDKVEGVEFVRTRPGERGPGGKRSITPIEGSEFVLPADTVIVAAGQRARFIEGAGETDQRGLPMADRDSLRTSVEGLYVAGDYFTGPSTVIDALASGRRAAERIAHDLAGRAFRQKVIRMQETETTDRQRTWDFLPRQDMPTIKPVEQRFSDFRKEVEIGLERDTAFEESKRCYLCYLHYEIDIGRCIYCRYCMDVAPRDCIKLVKDVRINEVGAITGFVETNNWRDVNAIMIDNSRCIRCGECMRVCPVQCISATRVELTERLSSEGESHV